MVKKMLSYFTVALLLLLNASPGNSAPGPDVILGNLSSLIQAGSNGTQVGLAIGTDICNNGDVQVNWFRLPETDHPVIPQNLYRMSGGANNNDRFEQIGHSWVMHQYFPLQQNACSFGCTPSPDFAHLGVGCSTADSASINGSQADLGSRAWVHPYTGAFLATSNSHTGHTHDGTTHRILVEGNDLNTTMNPGATYFAEAQLITPHEYAWCQSHPGQCNMFNNVSYRQFMVTGTTSFNFAAVGPTVPMTPAIFAWPGATIQTIEPEPGVDGRAFLAYKVTQFGPFEWHYEYAIYNQSLDRGINFFSVPAGCGIGSAVNPAFHAPLNHPGIADDGTAENAGYSNTPWTIAIAGRRAFWFTETFAQNPNANALRWGTLYNFRFDGGPPTSGDATIGFFKTGAFVTVQVPGPVPECTPKIPSPSPTATASPSPTTTPTPNPTLTPTPSATPSPVPTPILPPGGNGKIAFQSTRNGNDSDICVMDPDGSNLTNLTANLFLFLPDHDPDWSPDGTKIVFGINVDEFSQDNIYVMDANGANAVQLTNISKDFAPVWSPDGQKIAFGSYRDGNSEIYVMNADGSNPINLTNNPDEDGPSRASCTWSPDGGKIAFASNRGGGGNEIYVMAADGSNQVQLTNTPGDKTEPDWSPDGTKIAFANTLAGNRDIYVVNADGSNPIRLTNSPPGTNSEPNWSPDGTKIVFTSTRDPATSPGSNYETYVMEANGSNQTNLTNNPAPDFRPDWQRIAPPPGPTPTPSPATQALNLSTRMFVQTDDAVGIGGFIITGTGPKNLLLRAIGPSLTDAVQHPLADPVLELHGPGGFVTIINNNWRDTQEQEIIATGIPPPDNLESAILASLSPGGYTGVVSGNGNPTGVALIELYDLDPAADSKLANISTRAFVQSGPHIVIAGFILGAGSGADNVVVRGLGPSLSGAGVGEVLANPILELRNGNGTLLIENDNWQDDPGQAAIITAAGLAPSDEFESALAATLPPGAYTALLAGAGGGFGNGLVEVYDLGTP